RVTTTHPVPEAEHVSRIDAKLGNLGSVGRDGHEVLCNRFWITAKRGERPVACTVGVSHRLERREGLRRNDEQSLRRIEIVCCLDDVRAVNVRHEPERHLALAVMPPCFAGPYL